MSYRNLYNCHSSLVMSSFAICSQSYIFLNFKLSLVCSTQKIHSFDVPDKKKKNYTLITFRMYAHDMYIYTCINKFYVQFLLVPNDSCLFVSVTYPSFPLLWIWSSSEIPFSCLKLSQSNLDFSLKIKKGLDFIILVFTCY